MLDGLWKIFGSRPDALLAEARAGTDKATLLSRHNHVLALDRAGRPSGRATLTGRAAEPARGACFRRTGSLGCRRPTAGPGPAARRLTHRRRSRSIALPHRPADTTGGFSAVARLWKDISLPY